MDTESAAPPAPAVAIVTYVPKRRPADAAALRALLEAAAPAYRAAPGLIRKYFLDGDGGAEGPGRAGGVYVWESRAAGEAFFAGPWAERLALAADDIRIDWFTAPLIVEAGRPG